MKLNNKIALLCLTLLLPSIIEARKSDFTQAIDVQADTSIFDEQTGMQVLRGNVEISQGTMTIQAEEISVQIEYGRLSVIKGQGSPILFSQKNELDELIIGQCDEIIYDAANALLVLIGNASLKQPNQEMSGSRIEFNSKTQKVKAEGGESGRVNIKIQPPNKETTQ